MSTGIYYIGFILNLPLTILIVSIVLFTSLVYLKSVVLHEVAIQRLEHTLNNYPLKIMYEYSRKKEFSLSDLNFDHFLLYSKGYRAYKCGFENYGHSGSYDSEENTLTGVCTQEERIVYFQKDRIFMKDDILTLKLSNRNKYSIGEFINLN